jgi:hypothetical protein
MVTAPTITTVATLDYTIGNNAGGNTVTASDISNGVTQVFANGVLLDESEYTISGKIISFNTQPVIGLGLFVNVYPKQFYRLGNLFYTNNAIPTQELERVGRGDLFHLLSSSLTKPSTTYPIYVYEKNQITIYPTTITSGVNVSYIRKPLPPVWNFSSGGSGQYLFSQGTSFNFELHPSEQTELILKILLYAGVIIKSPEIIQVAASQVQQEQTNQKS